MITIEYVIVVFENLVSFTIFKGDFKILLLVKFDIVLGRHNCLTESCYFVMIM